MYLISVMEQLLVTGRPYWSFYYKILDDYVQEVADKRNVVLVGHSLGNFSQWIFNVKYRWWNCKNCGSKKKSHSDCIQFSRHIVQSNEAWTRSG